MCLISAAAQGQISLNGPIVQASWQLAAGNCEPASRQLADGSRKLAFACYKLGQGMERMFSQMSSEISGEFFSEIFELFREISSEIFSEIFQ